MTEQKLQTKILNWLKAHGYYCFKVVVGNRAGILDINGCTPEGMFFAIEVKWGKNKTSKLQDYNISEITKRHGIAIVAYSLEDVTIVLNNYRTASLSPNTRSKLS